MLRNFHLIPSITTDTPYYYLLSRRRYLPTYLLRNRNTAHAPAQDPGFGGCHVDGLVPLPFLSIRVGKWDWMCPRFI